MKKLFEVTVTFYAVAESESAVSMTDIDITACDVEAFEATCVESHWYDAIPFGSKTYQTCGDMLKNGVRE